MRGRERKESKNCPKPPLSTLHLHCQLHVCIEEENADGGEKEQFNEGPREGLDSFTSFLKTIKKK